MPQDIVAEAHAILDQFWFEISVAAETRELPGWLSDASLIESIHSAVNSSTRSYRYVLPTQLIAKLADFSLDSRCLQVARGGPGAFDARTIAHKVIVPFDHSNHNVLGGSPEPYVNNPLRVPEVSEDYGGAHRNRRDWSHLCRVLNAIEQFQDEDFTRAVLRQVLTEVYRRLSEVHVVYPTPLRISLDNSLHLIQEYLRELSGGDRLLALTSAIFVVIGRRFHIYSSVRRTTITAADAATGMLADLECVLDDGTIALVIEVKDKILTVNQMTEKVPNLREKQVSEIFFVAQQGVSAQERNEMQDLIGREFLGGHNIYVVNFTTLAGTALALLGEQGRRDFLIEVGKQLDLYRSDIQHRRAWATLLGAV